MKLITTMLTVLSWAACHSDDPEASKVKSTPQTQVPEEDNEIHFYGHGLATATSMEEDSTASYPDQRFVFRVSYPPGEIDLHAEVRAIDENLRPLSQDDCVDRRLIHTQGWDTWEHGKEKRTYTFEKGERVFFLAIYGGNDDYEVGAFEYTISDSDGNQVMYGYEKTADAAAEQDISNDLDGLMEGADCELRAIPENVNGQ